jgi:hypothetical protein
MTQGRNHLGQFLKAEPSKELVVIRPANDDLDFSEDCIMLTILRDRLFRHAIEGRVNLATDVPDIERGAMLDSGVLDAVAALDQANDGSCEIDAALAEWRQQSADHAEANNSHAGRCL